MRGHEPQPAVGSEDQPPDVSASTTVPSSTMSDTPSNSVCLIVSGDAHGSHVHRAEHAKSWGEVRDGAVQQCCTTVDTGQVLADQWRTAEAAPRRTDAVVLDVAAVVLARPVPPPRDR